MIFCCRRPFAPRSDLSAAAPGPSSRRCSAGRQLGEGAQFDGDRSPSSTPGRKMSASPGDMPQRVNDSTRDSPTSSGTAAAGALEVVAIGPSRKERLRCARRVRGRRRARAAHKGTQPFGRAAQSFRCAKPSGLSRSAGHLAVHVVTYCRVMAGRRIDVHSGLPFSLTSGRLLPSAAHAGGWRSAIWVLR